MLSISLAHSSRKVWFTSDAHFGHHNIIQHCDRPFGGVHHMNESMVYRWNEVVGDNDLVIVVGDFSLSTKDMQKWMPLLNGKKWLVAGNHDAVSICQKGGPEKRAKAMQAYKEAGWEVVVERMRVETAYGDFLVRHLPYLYHDDMDARYKELRTVEPYNLICGHVHEKFRAKRHLNGYAMINVGVDQWGFRPISIEDINNAMKELK